MFSTQDESAYGALVLVANGSAVANISGCIGIVDGDTSDTGCAAKYQVYEECLTAACEGCQAFESYTSCKDAAGQGVCRSYWQAATCSSKPLYNICRSYSTFDEYFFAMAQIFCLSGPDGGTTIDAGSIADGGGETGVSEPDANDGDAVSGDP
jgi:hypothetical protein